MKESYLMFAFLYENTIRGKEWIAHLTIQGQKGLI
jgi:hypothetical protein